MSETRPTVPIRPNQVTLAGWMIMVGSVLVVLTVFDRIAGLHSVEMREAIQKFLSEPPGEGLGLSVDGTLGLLKAISLVTAGCATAAAILGWQVLQRDRTARLALTVLAVPMFATGILAGGFFSALVAAASVMLWSQPARDWFDGITRPQRVAQPAPPASLPPGVPPGAPPGTPPGVPPLLPPGMPAFGMPPAVVPYAELRRPDQIVWAAALTWVCSGLTLILLAGVGIVFAGDSAGVIAEARKQRPSFSQAAMSDSMIVASVVVALVLLAVWAVVACVVAGFVWKGREWARITLLVSAGCAGALSIFGVVAGGVTLPLLIACGVVFRLLLGRPAIAWCRRPRR